MNKTFLFLISLLLFFSSFSYSQKYIAEGKVFDSKNREPLAFVNIIINNGKRGGVTDIDGKFKLSSNKKIDFLKLSYIGYETLIFPIPEDIKDIIISLKRIKVLLPEIEIFPGENPAHRIINNVVKNRDNNNYEKLKSFSYTSYDKTIFTINTDSITGKDLSDLDSTDIRIKHFFDEQYIFLIETISERKFLYPDKNYENVTATKVSGLKDPIFVFLISQMQSTSFYDELINISDKNYINPISKGSTDKYFFLLEDTTYTDNNDTVFIISFRPKKKTNFDGMKGVLYINSNRWAIQNVIAEPGQNEGEVSIKIQQMYKLIDGEQWFPVQLSTDIVFNNLNIGKYKTVGIGKSYIKNIVLNPELVKRDFSNIEVEIEPNATKRKDEYWNLYRNDSLTAKERKTYHVIDSIGKAKNFDKIMKSFEAIMTGRIPWGYFDLNINRFIRYNNYEGFALGLGMHTNDRTSKFFKLGGYWRYGFKDKTVKYGGDVSLLLNKNSELYLKFLYFNDVTESAGIHFFDYKPSLTNTEDFRNFLIKLMDKTEKREVSLSFRTLKYLKMYFSLNQTTKITTDYYDYGLRENNIAVLFNEFNFTETTIGLKYAYKEKFHKNVRTKISLGTKYPVFWLQYTKGFDNWLDGQYKYNKLDAKVEKSFYIKYIGKTSLKIIAGYIDGNLPYCNLYNGHGSFRTFTVYAQNSFATMRMNEFLSNKYFAFYFTHNFGKLLYRSEKFKPEIAVATNLCFGSLNNKENHFNVTYKTMENGYYESGILINNILGLQLYGVGLGVFYRYGPYGFDKIGDNFAYKFSITFLFNQLYKPS
ncbi:MAG: DUF5686 and carboxypeptidase regulatory-like domain-containing protein [Bacteroidales bacterium]|nr:DUF5686 and carboxypeptidase regulatory-like domain-containing protein [Bacteroidales bacterium]